MRILVQKFGGTSVDRPEHRLLAARKVIQAVEAGFKPVVVVSAIGRSGAPYATDTLIEALRSIDPQVPPTPRELDMMMACGEIISAVVFAHTLHTLGFQAMALSGGQAGILTDATFGTARILEIRPAYLQHLLAQDCIPVVCGFQGITEPKELYECSAITTLGRGGSDTTASALGAALGAESVEIFTDVDGVKTADPDLVPNARTLSVCTYEEVAEIAHQGAKVVHPRAAEIAMEYGIPLCVKSTFSDAPGTQIVANPDTSPLQCRITSIAHTGKLAYLRLAFDPETHSTCLDREVCRILAQADLKLSLMTVSSKALSFTMPQAQYRTARALLEGMTEGMAGSIAGLDAIENCALVSVIAAGHRSTFGVIARIYETLLQAGIPVYQTADAELSISCLIPENEVERAVRLLHERLIAC